MPDPLNQGKPDRPPFFSYGVEAPSKKFFQGEEMRCCMCGARAKSDPGVETQWRCIEADGVPFYVCPAHFPPDGSAAWRFAEAYKRVLAWIRANWHREVTK